MRLLGIDYGTKRIGIALSDEEGKVAFPHSVIKCATPSQPQKCATISAAQIKKICKENDVVKIILGKSVDYQGRPNPVMKRIEPFKALLEKETGLPALYEDETLTTKEAEEIQGKVKKIDASAAALILISYIEKQKVVK